jgi:hypothetical protein
MRTKVNSSTCLQLDPYTRRLVDVSTCLHIAVRLRCRHVVASTWSGVDVSRSYAIETITTARVVPSLSATRRVDTKTHRRVWISTRHANDARNSIISVLG